MVDGDLIERCAAVIDATAAEVHALKASARKGHYDKQSGLQIDYAVRWLRKGAERIRASKPAGHDEAENAPIDTSGPDYQEMLALLRELRPVIAKARATNWRVVILRRMDDLLKR